MARRPRILAAALLLVALGALDAGRAAAAPAIGPVRVVLIVDSSTAMASMLTPFRAGLLAFLDELPGTPETLAAEVVMLSTGGQMRIRMPATNDREKLRKEAMRFSQDGGANSFLDTMLEADKRFLRTVPDRRSVFVIMMTDTSAARGGGEPRIDEYNKFMRDFQARSGRAHAVVIHGMNFGISTDILVNITGNTGGYFDSLAVPNALPEKMKDVAQMVAADIP